MIRFVGIGSAFNTDLGNNSAFAGDVLIDCGETTFHNLKTKGLIPEGDMHILITHLHPDHVGSLGTLLFYKYYQAPIGKKAHVYVPKLIAGQLRVNLRNSGVGEEYYFMHELEVERENAVKDLVVVPIHTTHKEGVESFGYLITLDGERVYYSGDSNQVPASILTHFQTGIISRIYQDMCKAHYPNNVHLSIKYACVIFPPEQRGRVYGMHFDDGAMELAVKEGFQIPDIL